MKAPVFMKLRVLVTKQGRRFVAYTPALDISTSGKTAREAQKNFLELVNIFFEEIIEAGTVAVVLSELGWKKQQHIWMPPQVVASRSIGVSLPALV